MGRDIVFISREELEHSGILGMHWGIRRWQNPDGTLTEAGKIHYAKIKRREREKAAKERAKKAAAKKKREAEEAAEAEKKYREEIRKQNSVKRDLRSMTNEELQAYKARLELELDLTTKMNTLYGTPSKDKAKSDATKFVSNVLGKAGEAVAVDVLKGVFGYLSKETIRSVMKDDGKFNRMFPQYLKGEKPKEDKKDD